MGFKIPEITKKSTKLETKRVLELQNSKNRNNFPTKFPPKSDKIPQINGKTLTENRGRGRGRARPGPKPGIPYSNSMKTGFGLGQNSSRGPKSSPNSPQSNNQKPQNQASEKPPWKPPGKSAPFPPPPPPPPKAPGRTGGTKAESWPPRTSESPIKAIQGPQNPRQKNPPGKSEASKNIIENRGRGRGRARPGPKPGIPYSNSMKTGFGLGRNSSRGPKPSPNLPQLNNQKNANQASDPKNSRSNPSLSPKNPPIFFFKSCPLPCSVPKIRGWGRGNSGIPPHHSQI